ncbi:polysaccharide deacetylase family protein [Roseimicrobium gellanilyticum]|nr:polysaccharide deacetylase family protein [Roseimicrobium gellanilyticum]
MWLPNSSGQQQKPQTTGDETLPQSPPAELARGPQNLRQIALTFDAEGDDTGLEDLLRMLERERVSSTFFLTGRWAFEHLSLARMIAAQGHIIGNHSWDHRDLTGAEDWQVCEELVRTDDRFVGWFGRQYLPLFRAPYGEVNKRVLRQAQKLGFFSIRWTVDTLDAVEGRKLATFIEGRVLGKSDEELQGAIILMHVGYPETVEALPVIIHNLRERGFEFVTIPEWIPELQRRTLAGTSSPGSPVSPVTISPDASPDCD